MTLNSSRQQSHFPTDMDTMHCKSTVGKTSRNFLPVKHISRTSQTSYSSQSDTWQSDWFPTMTAHRSTLCAENRDPSGKQVIQTAPWKGTTSKNRKMSNNGLLTSLANNFYLYKTKQSNSKETHTHTHTHIQDLYWTTGHPLVMHLNLTVDLRGWKVYWKQSMHIIHIYIYPGPWRCQMLQNMLAALSRGYDHSGVEHQVPNPPTSIS